MPTIYWGSTGRHIDREIQNHFGFNNFGGWARLSDQVAAYLAHGATAVEMVGNKFRSTADGYIRVPEATFHFRAGFVTPPADYLEVCALHAEAPTDGIQEGLRTQCWLGLGTDGKFRLIAGWTVDQPAGGTVIATCPVAIDMDPLSPFDGASTFFDPDYSYLRRYVVRLVVSATDGRIGMWQEDVDGVLQQIWCEGGLNTQGDDTETDCFTWSIGQRAPGAGISPFPGMSTFGARYQDVVLADEPLGTIRFHTLFPRAQGTYNDFDLVDPAQGVSSVDGTGAAAPAANANTVVANGGWANPTNAYVDDGDYATAAPAASTTITTAYGFPAIDAAAIPDDSPITGISVAMIVKSSVTGSTGSALRAQFEVNGSVYGTNFTFGQATSDTTRTASASFPSGVTVGDLRTANNLRIRIGAQRGSGAAITWSLRFVQLTVTYINGATERVLSVRDDSWRDFGSSPDDDFTMVAQHPGGNGDQEMYQFEALPTLVTGESVAAVGLAVYMAGSGPSGQIPPYTDPINTDAFGFPAQAIPQIVSGATTIHADSRILYNFNDPVFDGYDYPAPPITDPDGQMGWFGMIPYQDWWSDLDGAPWASADVDAVEGGVLVIQRAVFLSQVTLLVITAVPMPSEGNPGGGGGGGGGGATDALLWPVDAQGRWAPVRTPAPGITDVQPIDAQGRRVPVEAAWVSDEHGRWVPLPIGDDSGDESGDPGDTGSPVVDCITPDFTGAPPPDPLTGRFYGMSRAPISLLGPLFTGTQEGTGVWTPGDITAAGAASSTIVSAQGAYAQFLTGGSWDRSKYEAWITATLAPLASALAAGTTAGSYFGLSMLDDIGSTALWGPGAIPLSDIHDLVPILKAALPGVRIGIRALPSAFPSNFGFDFHTCQFVAWRSQTAAQFAAANVSLCASRGAYAILSLNYLNGGDGSSGIRTVNGTILSGRFEMSATEVATYTTEMMADATVITHAATVAGMLGFQYSGAYLTRPGMIGAFTTGRNALAALP